MSQTVKVSAAFENAAVALSLQRLISFRESSLRKKKPASFKVQEMKLSLEMLGLDTKAKKFV